jgi:endonuclease/exonuclease/phosphatase family metal-dependent hydrolase
MTTRPRHRIRLLHASGRYDRPTRLLRRLLGWYSHQGLSILTGTEAKARTAATWAGLTGWSAVHLDGAGNIAECWLTYRSKVWAPTAHKTTAPLLSDDQYRTSAGALFPKFRALRVILQHRPSGDLFAFYVIHMPLDNTELRARVWVQAADGLATLVAADAAAHPQWRQIIVGDVNKNWRETADRGLCVRHIVVPTSTRCVWTGHLPKSGGTHGTRGIIDHAYVYRLTVKVARLLPHTRLMRRASDHWPFRYTLTWGRHA